jgi:hypothetical protein
MSGSRCGPEARRLGGTYITVWFFDIGRERRLLRSVVFNSRRNIFAPVEQESGVFWLFAILDLAENEASSLH